MGFAGFQGHTRPAQLAAQPHVLPVVRALIKEQGLARAAAVGIDAVALQVIREGLLHIKQHAVQARMFVAQAVQDFIHVGRLGDGAVEVRRQPIDIVRHGNPAYAHHARIVPLCVITTQLDLQAIEPISLDPVGQQHRVTVIRLAAGEVVLLQRIHSAHQMPSRQLPRCIQIQVVDGVLALKRYIRRRLQIIRQRTVHELCIIRRVNIHPVQLPVGIVQRLVKY